MIKHMDMEDISQEMEQFMRDNGKMISGMEKEKKLGQMGLALKEYTTIIRKTEGVSLNGLMGIVILESFVIIVKMGKELWSLQMADSIEEAGQMTKCMDMDNLSGHKERAIREVMRMIWNMDLGKWFMEMGHHMRGIGLKGNKMEKESSLINQEEGKKETGRMV